MSLKLGALGKSIQSLEKAINVYNRKLNDEKTDNDELDTIKAGVIQNFEFVYEQSWKLMKRWLEENVNPDSVDGISRKELYRMSAENKLIGDVDKWLEFHKGRNLTSHTYDADIADEVFEIAVEFLPYAKNFMERLEKVK